MERRQIILVRVGEQCVNEGGHRSIHWLDSQDGCVCHQQKYMYLKNKTITMWVPLWLYCVMLCFLPSGNVTGADDVWQHRNNQQASLRTNKQCLSHRRVGLKAHYVGFA